MVATPAVEVVEVADCEAMVSQDDRQEIGRVEYAPAIRFHETLHDTLTRTVAHYGGQRVHQAVHPKTGITGQVFRFPREKAHLRQGRQPAEVLRLALQAAARKLQTEDPPPQLAAKVVLN